MSAIFPSGVKNFTSKTDGVDKIYAAHINDIQNEVTAVEQALLGEIPDGNMQYVKKPATSTDNAIPRFDGTDGKKIQNSGVMIDDSNNIMVGSAPVPTSVATSTDNAVPRFDGTDGKKLQDSKVIIDDNGKITADGIEVLRFVMLTSPLTSTSWDGDAYSSTSATKIDMSATFNNYPSTPPKALLVNISAKDSGTISDSRFFMIGPKGTGAMAVTLYVQIANLIINNNGICPCDENGDIYYYIRATGSNTMNCWIEIWGYWI